MAKTKEVVEEAAIISEVVEFKGVSYDLEPYDEARLWQGEGREAGKTFCRLLAMNNMADAVDIPVSNIDEARAFQALAHLHLQKRYW